MSKEMVMLIILIGLVIFDILFTAVMHSSIMDLGHDRSVILDEFKWKEGKLEVALDKIDDDLKKLDALVAEINVTDMVNGPTKDSPKIFTHHVGTSTNVDAFCRISSYQQKNVPDIDISVTNQLKAELADQIMQYATVESEYDIKDDAYYYRARVAVIKEVE